MTPSTFESVGEIARNPIPPGPRDRLFGLTSISRFRREPLAFLTDMARTYGDIVYLHLGPIRSYLVNHPCLIREVLVAKGKTFVRLERQKRVFRKIDGNGLVSSEGDFWLRQRRLATPFCCQPEITLFTLRPAG